MYIAIYKHITKTGKIIQAVKADTLEKLIKGLEPMLPQWWEEENIEIYKETVID